MKYRKYKTHYLNFEENQILEKFEKGPTIAERESNLKVEIDKILSRPIDKKWDGPERSVPPMRKKKEIVW